MATVDAKDEVTEVKPVKDEVTEVTGRGRTRSPRTPPSLLAKGAELPDDATRVSRRFSSAADPSGDGIGDHFSFAGGRPDSVFSSRCSSLRVTPVPMVPLSGMRAACEEAEVLGGRRLQPLRDWAKTVVDLLKSDMDPDDRRLAIGAIAEEASLYVCPTFSATEFAFASVLEKEFDNPATQFQP